MNGIRRLVSIIGLLGLCVPALASDAFPTRTITIVVPYAAGGTVDQTARMLAEQISRTLGTTVIVENKPGASTIVGTEFVARAKPDGYTLLFAAATAFSINPHVQKNLPYKTDDFVAIGMVSRLPYVLTVANHVPVRSPTEFVEWASKRTNGVTYGTMGIGGTNHLLGIMIAQRTGLKLLDVPYKGNGPANIDLMAGMIDAHVDALSGGLPLHKAGKARIVGVLDTERWPGLDVPTFVESGFPDLSGGSWLAVVGPAAMPPDVQARLSQAVYEAVAAPAVRDKLRDSGQVPMPSTQAETTAFIKKDAEHWGRVIKKSNIKVD